MARQVVRRATTTGRFIQPKRAKSPQARVAAVRKATSRIRSTTVIKSTRRG